MKIKDRKITVSLAADLAESVDTYVEQHSDTINRSKLVEMALGWWNVCRQYGDPGKVFEEAIEIYQKRQERELYRSYFAELSDEAKEEAAGWRQIGEETASRRKNKHLR